MMEATPVASFIVVQAQLGFQFLVIPLDAPSSHGGGHQALHSSGGGQSAQPVVDGFGLTLWPFDEQPLLRAGAQSVRGPYAQRAEARAQRRVRPLSPRERAEAAGGHSLRHLPYGQRRAARVDHEARSRPAVSRRLRRRGRGLRRSVPDRRFLPYPHGVRQTPLTQLIAPVGLGPVGRIGQHYARRQARDQGLLNLFERDGAFGSEFNLGWHACALAIDKLTATWQFSVLPSRPQYCRPTPTQCVPFFANPVSSMIQ